jgi:hypothetical protein
VTTDANAATAQPWARDRSIDPRGVIRRALARALAPESAWSAVTIWTAWATVLTAAVVFVQVIRPYDPWPEVDRSGFLWPLRLWDYAHYTSISQHWYPEGSPNVEFAFFPLLAVILAVGSKTIGAAALGTIVAVAASAAAFVGVATANPSGAVRRTAVAMACMPTSYVLFLVYPDGLALAAAVWACILASRDRWAGAATLAVVASLARPNGFLVAVALLLLARGSTGRMRWAAVVAPPMAFGAVLTYFWWRSGSLFAFTEAQAWARGRPWELPASAFVSPARMWEGILVVFALYLCVRLWRSSLDRAWPAFATALLAMSLGSGTVWGAPRHMMFAFPLIWAAAASDRLRRWPYAVLGGCLSIIHVLVILPHVP